MKNLYRILRGRFQFWLFGRKQKEEAMLRTILAGGTEPGYFPGSNAFKALWIGRLGSEAKKSKKKKSGYDRNHGR